MYPDDPEPHFSSVLSTRIMMPVALVALLVGVAIVTFILI